MTITIDDVKQLRNKTGVSIMQCKKALEEAGGDMEKALINLTKKSGEIAAKKGDRELGAGVVSIVKDDAKTVVFELACETDFVANNEEFGALAQEIAGWVLSGDVTATDDEKITTRLAEATQKFGERTEVVRFDVIEGTTGSYVHSNNLIAAVVAFEGDVDPALAKQIAMHISAQNPKYMLESEITDAEMTKAKEVLAEEVADKPADMQEKILEGKINAYFKERVLMKQAFIMDPSKTVENALDGANLTKFVRYGVGEA